MRTGRALGLVCAVALVTCATVRGEDELAAELKFYGIKIERGADGQVSKVILPPGARDYHLELVLDNPAVAASVTELHAPRCKGSFARIKELASLRSLSSINFDGVVQANDYVACLAGMRQLKKLSLAESSLTNQGLFDLCNGLPALVELDVSSTQINNWGLSPLAGMEHLETLRLGRVRQGRPPLESTEEEQAEGQRTFRYVANLPRIRRISVGGLAINEEDVLALACNCNLEEFTVEQSLSSGFGADTATLVYLQECCPTISFGAHIARSLRIEQESYNGVILRIRNCTESQFLCLPKGQLASLEELTIRDVTNLEFLRWLPNLKKLTLSHPRIHAVEFARVVDAPTIEMVTITRAVIDAKAVDTLGSIQSLKQIGFVACDIGAAATERIEQIKIPGKIYISP